MTSTTAHRLAPILGLAAGTLLALSACSAQVVDSAEDGASAETASAEVATLPDGATWLFEIPSQSGRESGGEVAVSVRGVEVAHGTGQFLGCDGSPDVVAYDLPPDVTTIEGSLAMRDGVPDGIAAEVAVYLDDAPVQAWRIDGTDIGVPFKILPQGARVLTIEATLMEGTCTSDTVPYLVFVDTWVAP